ncbi:MAG: phage tail protein [Clostridium sp.]|nr:phage tail protein [Acetatifactor muris]MCM1527176.1 phage tail protein [Bacteroides sp.]MCM1562499.1 phage tail protein [Clostridium sp.]
MAQQAFPYYTDPLPGYRFIVSLNSLLMGFQKITGIGMQAETETYREGGMNSTVHIFPKFCGDGQVLCLEKGIYAGQENPLYPVGCRIPGVLSVMVTDHQGVPAKIYLFSGLIVKSWEIGEMSAEQNGILIDRFEVLYEDFRMVG